MSAQVNSFTVLFVLIVQRLVLQCSCLPDTDIDDAVNCPLWFIPDNTSSSGCVCNKYLKGTVRCDPELQYSSIRLGDCMTYDTSKSGITIGQCPYLYHPNITDHVYVQLPQNISDLNSVMCGELNREGLLCAHCKEGFGPAVYSVGGLQCKSCEGRRYGWLFYILLQIIPATLFFVIVMVFQIKMTAAPMATFVFYCQIVVITFANSVISTTMQQDLNGVASMYMKVLLTIYGIWNLDFFRLLVPPFCFNTHITNIQVLMFDYISAFYPLCLVLLTYILIELHDYRCRLLVWMWKPFRMLLSRVKTTWDVKASIIHTFATFLLLSYTKIVYISFQILHGTHLYNSKGEEVGETVSYFDPTVVFFSKQHLPYAITAVLVILVFVILPPLLLILYPTRAFRKCFTRCGLRRWHALRMFVETFQWCYKDGTEGTRDYRSLSGLYLVLRTVRGMGKIVSALSVGNGAFDWIYSALLFIILLLVFALVRPYKTEQMNALDSLLMALLAATVFLSLPYLYIPLSPRFSKFIALGILLLSSIPLLALILYITYKLFKKSNFLNFCKLSIAQRPLVSVIEKDTESNFSEESLPDRLINPEEYTPLLNSIQSDYSKIFEPTDSSSREVRIPVHTEYSTMD